MAVLHHHRHEIFALLHTEATTFLLPVLFNVLHDTKVTNPYFISYSVIFVVLYGYANIKPPACNKLKKSGCLSNLNVVLLLLPIICLLQCLGITNNWIHAACSSDKKYGIVQNAENAHMLKAWSFWYVCEPFLSCTHIQNFNGIKRQLVIGQKLTHF